MLHCHHGHQEALARISFLVQDRAIGALIGEVGSRKTVCSRAAISQFKPSRYSDIYLANPAIGARGIYAKIVSRLGGEPRFFKSALVAQASDLLAKEATERGRRVVVVVDESHLLDAGQLEELRLLTTPRWIAPRRSPCCSSVNRTCALDYVGVVSPPLTSAWRFATRCHP